jgi:hypothetical protein
MSDTMELDGVDEMQRRRTKARSLTRSLPHLQHRTYSGIVLVNGGVCMALSLCDVRCDPIADRALKELTHRYTVADEKSRLVLTEKAGNMKLFLNDLDDLHQWDFIHNQEIVKEIERLRKQRESWKVRAMMAEARLLEATAQTSNNGGCQNVSDLRYASLKRYLAKQFHPDYAPGQGIEKLVRNEIFKQIWCEIERLDRGVSATRSAMGQTSSAA